MDSHSERRPPETVVITGGTAGVGRATARLFAERGANVAVLARGQERLEETAREISAMGRRALSVPCDVADAGQVEAAADRVERELGPVDVWVNNAMTTVFAPTWQTEPEEFRRVTEVTYLGQVFGTLAALRRMRARNRGTIVLVGSAVAYRGLPYQAPYSAAKHAIQGFADSLRAELLHENSGVTLTMVQLPSLNTPQFSWAKNKLPRRPRPLGPVYQPEVAAEAIYWAAHHKRRELVAALPALELVMGNKLMPQVGDWLLGKFGFSGQMTAEDADPGRPNNLWEPVPSELGAHGEFDRVARRASPELWAATHRRTSLALTLTLAGCAYALWRRAR